MPANFPANPTTNQQYSYLGSTWSWTGSYWQLVTSQLVTGINFTYANAAPTAPNPGDRWVDTSTMLELVYVYDGNSYQWIELSSQAPSVDFGSIAANVVPAANVAYDLGSSTQRWRDLYLSGNTMYLGGATLSATGAAINLPAGSTVGGQSVASGADVSTGGGPKITNVQVTNNAWTVLDDTAVDIAGGYVRITGTNFVSGCQVVAGTTTASAVSFVSSTELRVQFGAIAAGTYILYVSNPDGGVALRVNGITFSASPSWQTASALPDQYDGVLINLSLVATEAVSYSVTAGSLPPGLTLNANTGIISGTITGVSVDTTYNFTVTATDLQLQDSPRAFSVTVTVSDPYFKLTTLLLGGEQGNTVVRDSSVNNFNLTVFGDSRASNFTPYGTGWSNYFASGQSNYLTTPGNVPSITGDYTAETWVYLTSLPNNGILFSSTNSLWEVWVVTNNTVVYYTGAATRITTSLTVPLNTWTHVALVRASGIAKIYINGVADAATYSSNATIGGGSDALYIGRDPGVSGGLNGYLSNYRIAIGAAVYTSNFTPSTSPLGATSGGQNPPTGTQTYLLTCQSNRFVDNKSSPVTLTVTGTPSIVAFNPFNITNTGDLGSAYFDGTGDYLSLTGSSLGSGNFTVEGWVYLVTSGTGIFFDSRNSDISSTGFAFYRNSSNYLSLFTNGVGTAGTTVVPINSWVHVSLVRNSGTIYGYMNGIQQFSVANTATMSLTGWKIFAQYDNTNTPNGYFSDFRITTTAVYTSAFTPPAAPLTAITNTQLLTLQYRQPHNNHTFLDNSNNQFVVGRTGNATQGAFTPFSQTGWSVYFDGTGDFLSITGNAATNFSGVDWTVESWFYQTALSGGINAICQSQTGTNNWIPYLSLGLDNSRQINVSINAVSYTSSQTYALNTWNHLAMVRSAGVVKVYLNGTATSISVTSDVINSNLSFWIGKTDNAPGGGGYLYYFNGYLSNLRFIKGTAVYTANFTPPTAPLISITNTSLLTCHTNRFWDASTNNFTVTISGDARVTAWSPFAPTQVYTPAVHGGSAYFDGSGDWLYLGLAGSTCHPNLKVPSGSPFSIEFWVYPQNSNVIINLGSHRAAYASEMALYMYYTAAIVSIRTGGTTGTAYTINFSSGNSLVSNEWQHVALVRESDNNVYLYRNGIRGTAVNAPGALDPYSSRLDITSEMGFYVGISQSIWTSYNPVYFQGYLSNLRYVVGTAVYTGNFTPPTVPVTAIANTQLLLDFTDAAILDRTGRNAIETVADAKSSSVQVKYGTGAVYFDGTGDYLTCNNGTSDFTAFGSGDFTIEMWIRFVNAATNPEQICLDFRPGAGNQVAPMIYILSNTIRYYVNGVDRITSSSVSSNQWYHLAISRSSSSTKMFIDGVQAGSTYSDTNAYISGATYPYIGASRNTPGSNALNGYIDDLRITKFARYTTNFTPPTAAHRLK